MDAQNPYIPSRQPADVRLKTGPVSGISAARAMAIVLASGFAFAVGGAILGCLLAVVAPGYYRAVFSSGNDPGFDPFQVGLGLGLLQGLGTGLVLGAIVVLAVAISHWRRSLAMEEFHG